MEDNDYSYKQVTKNSKASNGFGKSVLVPFASGVLGAGLVIGTCFGIPSIREKMLNNVAPVIASQGETRN